MNQIGEQTDTTAIFKVIIVQLPSFLTKNFIKKRKGYKRL